MVSYSVVMKICKMLIVVHVFTEIKMILRFFEFRFKVKELF